MSRERPGAPGQDRSGQLAPAHLQRYFQIIFDVCETKFRPKQCLSILICGAAVDVGADCTSGCRIPSPPGRRSAPAPPCTASGAPSLSSCRPSAPPHSRSSPSSRPGMESRLVQLAGKNLKNEIHSTIVKSWFTKVI